MQVLRQNGLSPSGRILMKFLWGNGLASFFLGSFLFSPIFLQSELKCGLRKMKCQTRYHAKAGGLSKRTSPPALFNHLLVEYISAKLIQVGRQICLCAGIGGNHLHLFISLLIQRHTFPQDTLPGLSGFLAVNKDPLLSLCLIRIPDLLEITVKSLADCILIAKHAIVQCDKALGDIGPTGRLVDIVGRGAA